MTRSDFTVEKTHPVKSLESDFKRLTRLLYDTKVPASTLKEEVAPYLADGIVFVDPWQIAQGKHLYEIGMAGFHAMFRFHFKFHQVNVQMNESGDRGRALVDGVMQLEQFRPLIVYPLRTMLAYDFIVPDPSDPKRFLITFHEEMWSFGDMIEAVPLFGTFYSKIFRPAFSVGFVAASKLAIRARSGFVVK